MKYSKKEKLHLTSKIVAIYSNGIYTLESCCEAVGVNSATFYQWACPSVDNIKDLPLYKQKELLRRGFVQEIQDLLKEARIQNMVNTKALIADKAKQSLLNAVTGYTVEEIHTREVILDSGETKDVAFKKVKKFIPPNTVAIIFALKNCDPENFCDKPVIKNSSDEKDAYFYRNLSDEDLQREIEAYNNR